MISPVLSVFPRASLVHTRKEDEMAFRVNYKFKNRNGSTALIFKRSLPPRASKDQPNVWTPMSDLLIFDLYNIILKAFFFFIIYWVWMKFLPLVLLLL